MGLRGKRILIAKPGLDGHDVGAKIIAMALRDAGAEVIYTGLRKTPETIAKIAVEEDVDAVGLSILTGNHKELAAETIRCLADLGAGVSERHGYDLGADVVTVEPRFGDQDAFPLEAHDITAGSSPRTHPIGP